MSCRTFFIGGLVAIASIIAIAAVVIPKMARDNYARIEHEWSLKSYQGFKTSGKSSTGIVSPENMVLLANDPECAQRLTDIYFSMTDLKAPEFALVQKLPNVRTIGFYDCDGIPILLSHAANMPSVNVVKFDYERPYEELLKALASIPNLKRVLLNETDDGGLDVFRRALPNVQVEIRNESPDRDPTFKSSADAENADGVQLQSPESPR